MQKNTDNAMQAMIAMASVGGVEFDASTAPRKIYESADRATREALIALAGGREEMRPFAKAGWKRLNSPMPAPSSAWRRGNVFVISALELAEAPDGSGEAIPQWHISVAIGGGWERRASDQECRTALGSFGMVGAEEDNHMPGVARHYFLCVDPARRVDCSCKETEETIIEADGYKWQRERALESGREP